MSEQEIRDIAQQLVDRTREFRRLEDDILQLKLEIYDDAKGGIKCNGGRVVFISETDIERLDKEILSLNLKNEFGLTDLQVNTLFENSQRRVHRSSSVVVYIDR